MAANVELIDTFDQWRVKTNQLLQYTQSGGGDDAVRVANTTDSTSPTTGSLIVDGGVGVAQSVTVGENLQVHGNIVANGNISAYGGTITLGNAEDDNIVLNADINSNIDVNIDDTYSLGNTTNRFATVYVEGYVGSNTDGAIRIPTGTTSKRPTSPTEGQVRYNNETDVIEVYNGSGWSILQTGSTFSDSDQDTKITVASTQTGDDDEIRFYTGNASTQSTERMNIIGSNVSIGTGVSAGDAMLKVEGTVNATGNSVFTGTTHTVKANTVLSNQLSVTGATTLSNTISVTGNSTFSNTISVTGSSNFANTISVTGNSTFSNTVSVVGSVSMDDTLTVSGDISTNSSITSDTGLTVNGPSTFNDNVHIIATRVNVEAEAEFHTSVSILGDLQVYGTTSTVSATNLQVEDNLIYLNSGNTQWTTTQTTGSGSPTVQVYDQYKVYGSTTYLIQITDTVSNPNKFIWSDDNGSTYNDNGGDEYDVSTTGITLSDGIKVVFDATTGYSTGDIFSATVSSTNIDIGFGGNYNNGAYAHTGLFRDATDGVFKFFDNYTPELDVATDINTAHASFRLANLEVEDLKSNTITLGSTTFPSPPGTTTDKFLAANGTWSVPFTTANNSTLGLVKIGYAENGKNYPVELSSGQMFVNVPWTDTPYTLPIATSSALGGVKLGSGTQQTVAAQAVSSTASRTYAIQKNASDQLVVNVPWSDTPYTLPAATSSTRGGVKIGYTQSGSNFPVQLYSEKMYVNVSGKLNVDDTHETNPTAGDIWFADGQFHFASAWELLSGVWATGGNLGTAREVSAGAGTQSAGLCMGGYSGGYSNVTEEYNGSTWSNGGNLGTARQSLAGAGTQNAGLCMGGYTGSFSNVTEEYNGTSWATGGNLGTARSFLAGAGTQNAGLCMGGSASSIIATTEEYNGTSWTTVAGGDLNTPRYGFAGVGTQNAGLCMGGHMLSGYTDLTEEYNGSTWSYGGNLSTARYGLAGAGTQNAGLCMGGTTSYAPGPSNPGSNVTQEYNGSTWSNGGNLGQSRSGLAGAGTQNAGLCMGGGYYNNTLSLTEEYTKSNIINFVEV